MATATPPQPDAERAAAIVGKRLEADLSDAGLSVPAARAIHHALELVVLRLLAVVATKQDLQDAVNGLRREFETRMDGLQSQFETRMDGLQSQFETRIDGQRREFEARFDALQREIEALDRKIDDVRREARWQFYILFALILMMFATMLGYFFG